MDIMEMNHAQLLQVEANLTGEEDVGLVRQLSSLITKRQVEEGIASGIATYEGKQEANKMDQQAHKRWPKLLDKTSEFSVAVAAEMEARGDALTNKRALLDAANTVGMARGDVGSGFTPSEETASMLNIKGPGGANDHGGEKKTYTEKHAGHLQTLVDAGFLDADDKESMARINAAGGTE